MAKVGAQRAAVLTGKSKSTIQRAMNGGKLSYELDQNNRRVIDVSELERVFGIKQQSGQPTAKQQATPASIEDAVEKERLKMQIKMLEQQLHTAQEHIDDLKTQRDKWEKQASQVLITSQYSQKQAEELRAEIREREERARQKRLQMQTQIQEKTKKEPLQRIEKQTTQQKSAPPQKDVATQMKKLKAGNSNTASHSSSMFGFLKKRAKG